MEVGTVYAKGKKSTAIAQNAELTVIPKTREKWQTAICTHPDPRLHWNRTAKSGRRAAIIDADGDAVTDAVADADADANEDADTKIQQTAKVSG